MLRKKFSILFMALVLCLGLVSVSYAAEAERPVISVDGSGHATAAPDMAEVSLGVVSNSSDAAKAQAENASKMQAIRQALLSVGIDAKDIQTEQYSINPVFSDDRRKITGYQVHNSLNVKVKDIAKVGKVVDGGLAAGANNINSLHFSKQNPEGMRQQALGNAIMDARTKANVIANCLGVKIVGVQKVTENVGSMYRPDAMLMKAEARFVNQDQLGATPIEAGELEIGADVHIDFLIQ